VGKTNYAGYVNGPLVTPDAAPGTPAAKFPYIDYGTAAPDPTKLYSPQQADREWEKMWTKVWNLAGLASDVPNVGDYFKFDLGVESFVIVRSTPSKIQAFYNVCPHRGNQVVSEDFGSVTDCFRCAFHGWQFGLDGELLDITEEQTFRPETIADRPGLTEVRCDVWNGIVFICMSEDTVPLLEYLAPLPEHLGGYRFDLFRPIRDVSTTWKASWKVSLDAFIEVYHVVDVHPELIAFADPYNAQYDLFENGMSRMIISRGFVPEVWGDTEELNEGLKNQVLSFGGSAADWEGIKGRDFKPHFSRIKRKWAERYKLDYFGDLSDDQVTDNWNYFIFPNITLNVFSDAMLLQRFCPHPEDPEQTVYTAIFLSIPIPDPNHKVQDVGSIGEKGNSGPAGFTGEVRPPRINATTLEELGTVLAQDAQLIPHVQKGVKSRAFKGYRLSEQEIRIRHYQAELEKYLDGSK
jgi:phenylpropionate dioxygenase-like ring-hydroxylating dioxygenase large terminal subunit